MTAPRLLAAVGVLLVVASALVLRMTGADTTDVGWVAYAPDDAVSSVSVSWALPREVVAAWVGLCAGTLLLAAAAGWWAARRGAGGTTG